MTNHREEPFIAPSADSDKQTRKKVLAGKGLAKVLLCLVIFIFVIWAFIGTQTMYHAVFDAKCIQTDTCV